ncbi:MAG: eCIS core domain-containing protein [Chitinophagaceae bacterium]
MKKIRIKENSWLAWLGAKCIRVNRVALTFGNTIHLHNATKQQLLENKVWLCHEIVHVKQYEKLGVLRFVIFYLWECIKKGYYNNKFEIEARENENKLDLLLDYTISEDIT